MTHCSKRPHNGDLKSAGALTAAAVMLLLLQAKKAYEKEKAAYEAKKK